MSVIVAPSMLSANPLKLKEELESVEAHNMDWHHIDVMDGHFVPNLTFGPPLIAAIKSMTKKTLDVHIMVSNPDATAADYIDAGADQLSFHVEAALHHHRLIDFIKSKGVRAGVSINPGTSLDLLTPLLTEVDYITVMSVNPGFGGQKYLSTAKNRVAELRRKLNELDRPGVDIMVDGGINEKTGAEVIAAGANALVAGSYIYGHENRGVAINNLKSL